MLTRDFLALRSQVSDQQLQWVCSANRRFEIGNVDAGEIGLLNPVLCSSCITETCQTWAAFGR